MADNSIVSGLFGVDPEQYQQQQNLLQSNQNMRMALLDPMQSARYSLMQGGSQLGNVGAQLFGVQDPVLKKASDLKQIASQFDTATPEGLTQMAKAAADAGYPQEAQRAIAAAQAMETAGLTQSKLKSETVKNLREQRIPTSPLGKLLFERDELIKEGVPLNDPKVLAYDKNIAAEGKGKGNVEVNLGGVFDKFFTKKEAEDQAETWTKAGQSYAEASKLGRSVREMEAVVGNAFVGAYGTLKAGISKALGGGKKLEDTEVLDALSAQLVLPLAKLLPGSLAVKELDQLIKTKPNLSQQEATIRRLLGTINQDLRASEITYEAGEKYRAENQGSIKGFNPYIANNKATRLTELQAIYNSKGKLTDAQKKEAKALADELKVEAL